MRLQRAEFVHALSTGADGRYAFRHAVTCEVAYLGLATDECRTLHGRVADAIEREVSERREEHIEVLAYHAFRAEMWEKAVGLLRRAGERAFHRSANHEAVTFLEQAMEACDRAGARRDIQEAAVDVRILLQLALYALGEHARIRAPLLDALRIAEALDDRPRQARIEGCLASNSYVIADYEDVIRSARAGIAIAEACADVGAQMGLLMRCGFAYHARGHFDHAIAALTDSLELLAKDPSYEQKVLNAIPSVHARTWLAWSLADRGDVRDAIACAEQALATATARAHMYSHVMATWVLGYGRLLAGDVDAAIAQFETSLELCRASNNAHWSTRVCSSLGYSYARVGRVGEGVKLLEQGTSDADRIGLRACSSLFVTWLGEAYARAGRMEDARDTLARAVERARSQGERLYEAYALRRLAEHEGAATGDGGLVALCERLGLDARVTAGLLGLAPLAAT